MDRRLKLQLTFVPKSKVLFKILKIIIGYSATL